jgi:hypothetical protein
MRRIKAMPFVPIKGTLAECLKNFGQSQGFWDTGRTISKKTCMVRNLIADLIGVGRTNIRNWFASDGQLPRGLYALKALYFLTAIGYQVEEMEEIPEGDIRWMSQFVGLSIVTPDQIGSVYGGRYHYVMGAIRGDNGFIEKSWEKIEAFLRPKENEIAVAKAKIAETLGLKHVTSVENGTQSSGVATPVATSTNMNPDQIIDTCSCLLTGLFPFVEHLSHHGTPEQRASLRKKIGDKTMFLISTHFNRLCSERARTQEMKKDETA